MNKYDQRYDFCLAQKSDIEEIMDYIGKHWKKGHILSVSREFFEYEFLDGEDVHFILVRDRQNDGVIAALNGYYFCSKDKENLDIWGTLWSVRNDLNNMPLLGVEIGRRRDQMVGSRSEIGVGDNEKTAIPVLGKLLKNRVGKLEHYYLLNDLPDYKIAKIENKMLWTGMRLEDHPYYLRKIDRKKEIEERFDHKKYSGYIPYKDSWYFEHRFFEHPIYRYDVYGIYNENGNIETILVFRKVSYNQSHVLRLVDCTGNKGAIRYIYNDLKHLLEDGSEYIDFYCLGFEEEDLKMAGFIKREENDVNIIPNFFEPFLQENIEIWFNSTAEDVTICKADADQDRPSRLR